jgi:hypothetical protein
VVSWHDEHRNASICYSAEGLERLERERRDDPGPVEDVASVHYDVHLARERRLQRGGVVREEVVAAAPSVDTRSNREIEAEVGIGQEEDSDVVADQSSASVR